MDFYDQVVLPRLCDLAMRNQRLRPYRERVIGAAKGRVLEIGAGSGLNLALYGSWVIEVIALEPDPKLVQMARRRATQSSKKITFVKASAEAIPLDVGSVDCVVTTWTLCTIANVPGALEEMRRVLRPDGKLLFVEHGLAPEPTVRKWQNRLTPLRARFSGGCHLDRPIKDLIQSAGFQIEHLDTDYLPGPKIMTYLYEGSARPRCRGAERDPTLDLVSEGQVYRGSGHRSRINKTTVLSR